MPKIFAEFIESVKEEEALAEKSPGRKRQYIENVSQLVLREATRTTTE